MPYTFPSLQITEACFMGGGYSQLIPLPEYPPVTGGNGRVKLGAGAGDWQYPNQPRFKVYSLLKD